LLLASERAYEHSAPGSLGKSLAAELPLELSELVQQA